MAVVVLGPDLVLAVVAPQRLLDLKDRVVVGVGDLDPGVLLGDQGGLLLSDEALALGPGLIGDGLSNNIDRPAVGSTDLLRNIDSKLVKLKLKSLLYAECNPLLTFSASGCLFPKLVDSQRTLSFIQLANISGPHHLSSRKEINTFIVAIFKLSRIILGGTETEI